MNKYGSDSCISLLSILVVCIFLLTGCRQETEQPPPAGKVERDYNGTIVAVGDSLTAGQGVAEELSYPAQLQKRLLGEGRNYRVINAGVSAETSSGTLSRLNWILTMQPDIVILETGANDGLRGIDPDVPKDNLDQILTVLAERKIITILAGMKMVWNLGPEYTTTFNKIYPQVAANHDVIFMPFFLDDVAAVPALNNADGIHPNGAGYQVIVENIYPFVIEAINRFEKLPVSE